MQKKGRRGERGGSERKKKCIHKWEGRRISQKRLLKNSITGYDLKGTNRQNLKGELLSVTAQIITEAFTVEHYGNQFQQVKCPQIVPDQLGFF